MTSNTTSNNSSNTTATNWPAVAAASAVAAVAPTRSPSATYLRSEMVRTLRNRRFFIFSLVFPLVLYFLIAGANRHQIVGGIAFPVYYMAGMVSWGTMAAVLAGGARIAAERSVGWNRQLRTTPLKPSVYLAAKVATGYAMAAISIVLLYVAGASLGVRLGAVRQLEMTGLILVGLVPFAAFGVLLGHLLTVDSMGPAMGGITSLFALIGGSWGPFITKGPLLHVVECIPSYWLVQSAYVGLGGDSWPLKAWIVIIVWTVVLVRLAMRAYHRDTKRV